MANVSCGSVAVGYDVRMRILMRAWLVALTMAHLAAATVADEAEVDHDPASRMLRGDEADHERARRALEAGEIVPLDQILQQVQAHYDGTVIEIELARQDGRWVYEVELLGADGRLLTLWIDASDARLLREVLD